MSSPSRRTSLRNLFRERERIRESTLNSGQHMHTCSIQRARDACAIKSRKNLAANTHFLYDTPITQTHTNHAQNLPSKNHKYEYTIFFHTIIQVHKETLKKFLRAHDFFRLSQTRPIKSRSVKLRSCLFGYRCLARCSISLCVLGSFREFRSPNS